MKKSRAVKKETFKVLNDRFLDKRRILRIDEEYLNSEIQAHLMSDEKLYNQIKNIKKPDEIVKGGLVLIANILLNTKYIEGDRHATKKQIEDWLRDEGRGDLSILESIEYVEQERIMLKNTEN